MGDEQGERSMLPGENLAEQEPVTHAELSALIQGVVERALASHPYPAGGEGKLQGVCPSAVGMCPCMHMRANHA